MTRRVGSLTSTGGVRTVRSRSTAKTRGKTLKKPLAVVLLVASVALIGAACRPSTFPWHPTAPPPAPRNVELTAGDRSITATFTRGFGPGLHARVTGYRLTCNAPLAYYSPPLGPGWTYNVRSWNGEAVSVDGNTSPLVLSFPDQMVNGNTYSCTVQAVTRRGVGTPSAPQDVTPVGPPRVAWVDPIRAEPGAALVFVNVYLESDDSANFSCDVEAPGTLTQVPEGCTFSVSGLEPGTDYTATVTPSTSHGTSEPHTFTFSTGA